MENKLVSSHDAQYALKELFAETLQEMLGVEMHLDYQKHYVCIISRRPIATMAKARKASWMKDMNNI